MAKSTTTPIPEDPEEKSERLREWDRFYASANPAQKRLVDFATLAFATTAQPILQAWLDAHDEHTKQTGVSPDEVLWEVFRVGRSIAIHREARRRGITVAELGRQFCFDPDIATLLTPHRKREARRLERIAHRIVLDALADGPRTESELEEAREASPYRRSISRTTLFNSAVELVVTEVIELDKSARPRVYGLRKATVIAAAPSDVEMKLRVASDESINTGAAASP